MKHRRCAEDSQPDVGKATRRTKALESAWSGAERVGVVQSVDRPPINVAFEVSMKHGPHLAFVVLLAGALTHADEPAKPATVAPSGKTDTLPADLSGHKRVGKASIYAKRLAGHKMADGAPMQTQGDNAASKTLPIGTTAKVTNVETGASAVVKIEDRGPYVKGRIVDLSPSTAHKIGIDSKEGVAKVSVEPIEVPLPNGETKAGVAAHDPPKH